MLKVHPGVVTHSVSPAKPNTSVSQSATQVGKKINEKSVVDVISNQPDMASRRNEDELANLALPSRSVLQSSKEDQLSYFIGSNIMDTHVQMYAEIESDKNQIIATLYRDDSNVIQVHLEKQKASSWFFSKESLMEVVELAREELKQFPDTKITEED